MRTISRTTHIAPKSSAWHASLDARRYRADRADRALRMLLMDRRIRQTRSESPSGSRERMAQRQPLIRLRPMAVRTATFRDHARRLSAIGRRFYARDWVLGTSGNFSAVLSRKPAAAGHHGERGPQGHADRPAVSRGGRERRRSWALAAGKPSAETRLHLEIVEARGRRRRLAHPFGLGHDTFRSPRGLDEGLAIEGYEMLKGLDGVTTHEHREWIPIVENDQDMVRLAGRVRDVLDRDADRRVHAFLLRGHGLYTWGRDASPTPSGTSRFSSFCSRHWAEGVSHGGNQNSRSGPDD